MFWNFTRSMKRFRLLIEKFIMMLKQLLLIMSKFVLNRRMLQSIRFIILQRISSPVSSLDGTHRTPSGCVGGLDTYVVNNVCHILISTQRLALWVGINRHNI
jgi:hypothetical protein